MLQIVSRQPDHWSEKFNRLRRAANLIEKETDEHRILQRRTVSIDRPILQRRTVSIERRMNEFCLFENRSSEAILSFYLQTFYTMSGKSDSYSPSR